MTVSATPRRRVALVTLGCTRNDVDSEELAGRLQAEGWELVDDAADADVAVVNTCGFVEQAKKDSIDALLEASDLKSPESGARTQAVVAVGCLAERYGAQLASQLPEADAVLGFDAYASLSDHLGTLLRGGRVASHTPSDRRKLLPLTPAARPAQAALVATPGHAQPTGSPSHAYGPPVVRARLDGRPWAPLKIASGCDRRCAFCAIPMFRGAFLSRRPADVLAEARWLAGEGVREVFLVSENSTSYGKDLGDLTLLESLLPELAAVDGIDRVRVSYLQPAEIRPGLLRAMAETPGVVPYYDISFQHASEPLLRRMRRFGSREAFLDLLGRVRSAAPLAGIRSNVIVGFPGETEEQFCDTLSVIEEVRFSTVYVAAYSPRPGTLASRWDDDVSKDEKKERVQRLDAIQQRIGMEQHLAQKGKDVEVLVESAESERHDLAQWRGRTRQNRLVFFPRTEEDLLGEVVQVRIEKVSPFAMQGAVA